MASARDGTDYDLPPDRSASVITNGFWAYATNVTNFASVVSAQAQSGARQRAGIQPLVIIAEGDLNAAASIDTNRSESASAQAGCRLDLLFTLPVQHSYSINVTNLGSVSPGILLGQIVLTRNTGEEIFASRLPTNSGPSSQSGLLLSGSYRLLAEYVVSPLQTPPASASSGSASYSLRIMFAPIFPTLDIVRSSNNVILSWTTNDTTTFLLQSNTNLTTTNWTFIYGPYPISGDQYTAEQSASEASVFYRLIVP